MIVRISDAYQSIIAAYNDWGDDFLGNPRYIRNDIEVTWADRETRMRHEILRISHVSQMAASGQYTFQIVEDGSLLQIYYSYDRSGNNIQSACLAFYASHAEQAQIDEEVLLNEYSVLPIEKLTPPSLGDFEGAVPTVPDDAPIGWLRIDYDPNAKERGVTHHDCHLHISCFPNARFIVAGIPTPRQFIEFIVSAFYPHIYRIHCLRLVEDKTSSSRLWEYNSKSRIDSVNSTTVPFIEYEIYQQIAHFKIPSGT